MNNNNDLNFQNDINGKIKPLSTFDHFMKNTSQALMTKGKDTPTQTTTN
jgi:hypothetical protein